MTVDALDTAIAPETITITPLAIDIGAEIGGVDLSRPLSDRQLFRTTTVGDIPYGVDGQQSKPLEGTPLLAA